MTRVVCSSALVYGSQPDGSFNEYRTSVDDIYKFSCVREGRCGAISCVALSGIAAFGLFMGGVSLGISNGNYTLMYVGIGVLGVYTIALMSYCVFLNCGGSQGSQTTYSTV